MNSANFPRNTAFFKSKSIPAKSSGKIVIKLNFKPSKNGNTNCLAKMRAESLIADRQKHRQNTCFIFKKRKKYEKMIHMKWNVTWRAKNKRNDAVWFFDDSKMKVYLLMALRRGIGRRDHELDPLRIPKPNLHRMWDQRVARGQVQPYSYPIVMIVDQLACQHSPKDLWMKLNAKIMSFDCACAIVCVLIWKIYLKSVGSSTKNSVRLRCLPSSGRIISNPLTSVKLSILSM